MHVLRAVARRVVTPLATADEAGWQRFDRIVTEAVADRPATMQRQLGVFLKLIQVVPVLRWGRPFTRLDGARQDRLLSWLEDHPVGTVRAGFWGLKTLTFMGWYGQPEVTADIGYVPHRHGDPRWHDREVV